MTALTIPAGERHTLRVFSARLTPVELARLRPPAPTDATPYDASLLAALLGVDDLVPGQVELFDGEDVAAIGLAAYLTEGTAVAESRIAADRARLDALTGPVLILHSAAFAGQAVTLDPDRRLTLIGTYAADVPPVRFEPLPDASAHGSLPGKPPKAPMSSARAGGMVATVALLVMFVLVAVVIWVAG